MANHLRGEVELKALGRTLVYRLGVNQMLALQNALGLADQDDAFAAIFDKEKLKNLGRARAILFHGLQENDPPITEGEAGDIIVEIRLFKLPGLIEEALKWALPPPEERKGGPPARPSPGPTSS